jgi:hypothetical protein
MYRYKGGGSAVFGKSKNMPSYACAPGVGKYKLKREFDENRKNRNDTLGHKYSSSFNSSGRDTEMMSDALHWRTKKREDPLAYNLGPGYYEQELDTIGLASRSHLQMCTTVTYKGSKDYDRPWLPPKKDRLKAENKSICNARAEEAELRKTKSEEIDAVKKLPGYP